MSELAPDMIVGRRITAIRQLKSTELLDLNPKAMPYEGKPFTIPEITVIELDDGTRLVPVTWDPPDVELRGDLMVIPVDSKPYVVRATT